MKEFSEDVLAAGEYPALERIQTPQPGDVFDLNKLAVAAVLTLNTMIGEFVRLQERVAVLEQEAARPEPIKRTAKAREDKPFKLTKLAAEYEG